MFKLIRVDVQKPKINLSVGKHTIGRAKFLHDDDTDKRVSRIHAELEVTEDTVSLKSLHQNPCFYTEKSSKEIKILQQGCEISLNCGDRFGLLPDNFWYELIHIVNDDNNQKNSAMDDLHNGIEKVENEVGNNEKLSESESERNTTNVSSREEVAGSNDLPDSQAIMNTDDQSTQEYNVNVQVPADSTNSPMKRSLSPDSPSAEVKKVKTEPNDGTEDATAGPSNSGTGSDPDTKDASPTQQSPNMLLPRERCIYGANCYRRNEQHRAQFSHPADGDWGAGARGRCPWGGACRRRDPRHWAAHTHPPHARPPSRNDVRPAPGKKRRRRKVSEEHGSSDVSDEADNLVTGKRVRKTIKRDTWSASDDENVPDPYQTDELDEWLTASDVTSREDTEDF